MASLRKTQHILLEYFPVQTEEQREMLLELLALLDREAEKEGEQ